MEVCLRGKEEENQTIKRRLSFFSSFISLHISTSSLSSQHLTKIYKQHEYFKGIVSTLTQQDWLLQIACMGGLSCSTPRGNYLSSNHQEQHDKGLVFFIAEEESCTSFLVWWGDGNEWLHSWREQMEGKRLLGKPSRLCRLYLLLCEQDAPHRQHAPPCWWHELCSSPLTFLCSVNVRASQNEQICKS